MFFCHKKNCAESTESQFVSSGSSWVSSHFDSNLHFRVGLRTSRCTKKMLRLFVAYFLARAVNQLSAFPVLTSKIRLP